MYRRNGTPRSAGILPAVAAGAIGILTAIPAAGQAVKTVNGAEIDKAVFDLFVQSRTNRAPEQLTQEQRDALLAQLTDVYLLTTQDVAAEVRRDPQVQAQIELQTRGIVAQAIAGRFIADLQISDEEIEAEYAAQTELAPPMQFKARHILLESQGQAADVISELDGGADFAELAQERSTGPSAPSGGDLGWFSPEQMVEPFSNAVAALEDGAYTAEPVQTQFGWHVIMREESRASEAPPLESVRQQIVQRLQQQKFTEYVESLRNE